MCSRLIISLALLLLRCTLRASSVTTDLVTLSLTTCTLLTELEASIAARAPTVTTVTAATQEDIIAIVVDKLVVIITAEEAS
jgi:hypothetical protein